ncbi:MAG: ABC transporter ATP-binding protein, partial [Erysipelotrichaceae bacterium]|nr:ABC transporter ATP-binding protein [Erysipelotrichaceae bacterium]
IFGKDIATHQQEILADVGFMSSEGMFYNGMKVKDIIRLSADLRKKDCKEEARRLCDILQLDTSRKIEELSLGNRKKVSIVCAMQHRPSLYIFDEPTSGLDPLIQHEFFSLLRERNKEKATIFLSSHILSEIQRYCDKAAIIREGKIVAYDNVDKLTKTTVRRVTLTGDVNIDNLTGVSQVRKFNGSMTFFYEGDINDLISVLDRSDLKDVMINEPDLEEVFMHYYKKEGETL